MLNRSNQIRATVDDGQLLWRVLAAIALEVIVRGVIIWVANPLLAVALPPVITVVGLGLLISDRREANTSNVTEKAKQHVALVGKLAAIAVVGQLFALVVGGGLFLTLDTAGRAVLYSAGYDIFEMPALALAWPLFVTALGTAVAWTVPGLVAAGIAADYSPRRAFMEILGELSFRPRTFTAPALWLAVTVVVGSIACVVGYVLGMQADSVVLFVGASGALGVVLMVVPLATATIAAIDTLRSLEETGDFSKSESTGRSVWPSVARFGLATFLILSLTVVAGVVRTNNMRPIDTSPDQLGDDPQEIYQTAFENTYKQSHAVKWIDIEGDGKVSLSYYLDRSDRELQLQKGDPNGYYSPGVATGEITGVDPPNSDKKLLYRFLYQVNSDPEGDFYRILTPGIDSSLADGMLRIRWNLSNKPITNWTIVENDEKIVLESTDPHDAWVVTQLDNRVPDQMNSSDEGWVRATIDQETKTVRSVAYKINHTDVSGNETEYHVSSSRWEFGLGTEVDRPSDLGSPSLEERIWQLLLY